MTKASADEPDGRAAQCFGQIEPGKNREQPGQDINDHRVVKRLHLVEEHLGARLGQRRGKSRVPAMSDNPRARR